MLIAMALADLSVEVETNESKGYRQYWDEVALRKRKHLPEFLYSWHELVLDEVKGTTRGARNRVLDLGCGDGKLTVRLAEIFKNVTGLDFSASMLRVAAWRVEGKNLHNVSLICGDATRLPFKDRFFDAVVSSELLEHMPQWEFTVKEISRVLNPSGHIYLTTPNPYAIHHILEKLVGKQPFSVHEKRTYDRPIIPKQIDTALRGAGFMIVKRFNGPFPPTNFYKSPTYRKFINAVKLDFFGHTQIIHAVKTRYL